MASRADTTGIASFAPDRILRRNPIECIEDTLQTGIDASISMN
jgi:hypothetical protein